MTFSVREPLLIKKTISDVKHSVYGLLLTLDNGVLLLIGDSGYKLGAISIATPMLGVPEMGVTSSLIFPSRDTRANVLSRILSERCARALGIPCMAIVNIKLPDHRDLQKLIIKLLDQLISEAKKVLKHESSSCNDRL